MGTAATRAPDDLAAVLALSALAVPLLTPLGVDEPFGVTDVGEAAAATVLFPETLSVDWGAVVWVVPAVPAAASVPATGVATVSSLWVVVLVVLVSVVESGPVDADDSSVLPAETGVVAAWLTTVVVGVESVVAVEGATVEAALCVRLANGKALWMTSSPSKRCTPDRDPPSFSFRHAASPAKTTPRDTQVQLTHWASRPTAGPCWSRTTPCR